MDEDLTWSERVKWVRYALSDLPTDRIVRTEELVRAVLEEDLAIIGVAMKALGWKPLAAGGGYVPPGRDGRELTRKLSSAQVAEVLAMRQQGAKLREIATRFEVSIPALLHYLPRRKQGQHDEEARARLAAGQTMAQVSRELGLSDDTVRKIASGKPRTRSGGGRKSRML